MSKSIRLLAAALAALGAAGGCASRPKGDDFAQVGRLVAERTGHRVHWNLGTPADTEVEAAVRSMLAGELTADTAVQVALLNNRNLQATYEDLGVAQAELVQAGLLHNPVFDLTVRWPDESPRTANVEIAVVQDFLDVFFIPARKRVARARFDAAQLRVAHAVLDVAG